MMRLRVIGLVLSNLYTGFALLAAWQLRSTATLAVVATMGVATTTILCADFSSFRAGAPGGFRMEAERSAAQTDD
jgi:hypothetical protein